MANLRMATGYKLQKEKTCGARVRATGYGLYSHYLRVEAEVAVPTLAIMG